MLITWPATLPLPTIDGYGVHPGEAVLRTEMEAGSARQRRRDDLIAELREIVEAMTMARKADDVRAYLNNDTEFHAALFRHCGNPYMAKAYSLISGKMAALRNSLGTNREHMRKSFEEHKLILDAVLANDPKTASAILEGHIGRKEGSYWNLMASEPRE